MQTWKLSPSDKDDIVRLYQSGISAPKLSEQFGVRKSSIRGVLKRRGVVIRGNSKLNATDKDDLVRAYETGSSTLALGQRFGILRSSVRQILKDRGIDIRTNTNYKFASHTQSEVISLYQNGATSLALSDQFNVAKCSIDRLLRRNNIISHNEPRYELPVNHASFAWLTCDVRYWAGFLIADGCVHDNEVTLTLSDKDADQIHKFKSFLSSEHKIRTYRDKKVDRGYIGLTFTSRQIVSDLNELGITPRKTFTAEACLELAHCRDFWRGVVDGDGCLGLVNGKIPYIELIGSEKLMHQFKDFINATCNHPVKVHKLKNIFRVRCNSGPAVKLIKVLYAYPSTSLTRKQLIADRIINGDY